MRVDHQATRHDMGTASIAELIGCSYSKVIRWVAAGLLGDAEPIQPGSGCTIILDDRELEQAWACARLSEMRATKSVMAKAMAKLRRLECVTEGDVLVVWPTGDSVLMRRSDVMPTDPAWVIPLATSAEILDRHPNWVILFGGAEKTEPVDQDGVFVARQPG